MHSLITRHIDELSKLCEDHSVAKLYAFGSITSKTFTNESDIDLLVQFRENVQLKNYADNFFDFRESLEHLLQHKIDLITEDSIQNPYFVRAVNSTKKIIYDREGEKISL